jgi:predicted ATPase
MEYLKIENFKCFNEIEIPLNQLTILAGANGNGKSTVIQSLLFLRRSIEHCSTWRGGEINRYQFSEINGLNVELNGPYCLALGNSEEIIPKNSKSNILKFGIRGGIEKFGVSYKNDINNTLWLTPFELDKDEYYGKDLFSLFEQEFYYLNAERVGPRVRQDISFFDFPNTGFKGEYVAQLIGDTNFNYTFEVEENRRNSTSKSKRLEQQVNAWLDYIMPGVSVTASYDINTLSAQIKISNNYTIGESTIATNIGFGISYVLPIIVSGLIAKKGSYLVIENPEAHLHPSAQSNVGRFLSVIAKSGVKVIVETHSDHFVNGIQIAAALNEISNDEVTINFFSHEKVDNQPKLESISINKKGELSLWPKGFFDQTQIDFAQLFKIRKG